MSRFLVLLRSVLLQDTYFSEVEKTMAWLMVQNLSKV